jgi:hypothetical protein
MAMHPVSVEEVGNRGGESGAGNRLRRAVRRITRCLPAPWRAAFLLAATVVFFPVIVGAMIVASLAEDLPLARESQGVTQAQDGGS